MLDVDYLKNIDFDFPQYIDIIIINIILIEKTWHWVAQSQLEYR